MAEQNRGNPKWKKGMKSPNPKGRPRRSDAADVSYSSGLQRLDGWNGALGGFGDSSRDKRKGTKFESEIVGYQQARDLWRGDPIGARIVEAKPREMIRQGFKLVIGSEDADSAADAKNSIEESWKRLQLDRKLRRAVEFKRAYGGSAMILGVNDGQEDKARPLNLNTARSFDWITVLEAQEIIPAFWYNDPFSPNFGKPEIYQITTTSPGVSSDTNREVKRTLHIHESRLIAFDGIRVSNTHTGSNSGWGDSVFGRVWEVLRDFNVSWASAAVILRDFAQPVYKMKGLADALSRDRNDVIQNRIAAVELSRSTIRAVLMDSEESFSREQTPLGGMPDMLDRFASLLAAAADMPLTLLMGQSPGGLNATGESDIRFYYDRIKSAQTEVLEDPIKRITEILFAIDGGEPEAWDVEFNPLWQPSEAEKAAARKVQAESDSLNISNSILTPDEVAQSRFGSGKYSFDTTIDIEGRESMDKADLEVAQDEIESLKMQIELLKAGSTPPVPDPPDDTEQVGADPVDDENPEEELDEDEEQ